MATVRVTLDINPPLAPADRKTLSAFVQGLKRNRPDHVVDGNSFQYRGSTVTIQVPAKEVVVAAVKKPKSR